MADDYYNQNQYPAPPGSGQYYPPQPPPQQPGQGGHAPYGSQPQGYYPPPPQSQQGGYQPAQDEQYRNTPSQMQVGRYQETYPYDDRHSSVSGGYPPQPDHRGSQADYYEGGQSHDRRRSGEYDRDRGYDGDDRHRERHGSSHSDRGHRERHGSKAKDIGASLLGAAVGGFAGHELGHDPLTTVLGAAAGAFGGHELEKRHERHKEERRESGSRHRDRDVDYSDPYGDDQRRSRGGDSDRDSDYDRGHHHHHHHHHSRD